MRCVELEGQWEEWLAGGAPAEVEQHLRECARCRELAESLARTPGWLSVLTQPPPEPSPAFWPRLRERLEGADSGSDFWAALAWAAGRAALTLAVLVFLLALWVTQVVPERVQPAVAEFDAPQTYLEEAAIVPAGDPQAYRNQVILTLVTYSEPAR
ncbi:MAG: anti-sigma factor family protein [Terriglobia bacterium]